MKLITNIFVSFFYVGFLKQWPGTYASLLSIGILFPFFEFKIFSTEIFLLFFIITFILSIFFIRKFSNYTNSHDSSVIVIDEFLGIFFIFMFYEYIYIINSYFTLFLIFVLFRFFDIYKIYPANIIDKKMKNSIGVILDDIVASLYTIFILFILNVYS